MARKKNNAEDDWFEDDFEEVKPKKKRGRRKKKNTGKIIALIVAFVVILAILLFIQLKYAAPPGDEDVFDEFPEEDFDEIEEAEPEEYEEAEVYEAPKEVGPDVVEREELPKVYEVVDTTAAPELFSNLECNFDYDAELLYISLRIYNVLDEEIRISPRGVMKGYNTYFLIRGIVDTDPGCGTELLPAGEWTECKRIGFDSARYGNVEGINRISVQVPGKTEALLINCPKPPAVAEEEE
jgi:hypothetical protein